MTTGLHAGLLKRDAERRARRKQAVTSNAQPAGTRRNDLLPRLSLVSREPSSLRAAANHVHKPDAKHIVEVATSIAALGFTAPVIIDPDGMIVDGVTRVEAARQLGLASIPCIVTDAATPQERKLLRIGLNRLSEKATWDIDALQIILGELMLEEAPIEVTGLDRIEIDAILLDGEVEQETAVDLPAPDTPGVSRLGDVFQCGEHLVLCGDASDAATVAGLLEKETVRLVLTDVPYNVPIKGNVTRGKHREFAMASGEMSEEQFSRFNEAWIAQAAGHLVDGGLLATFIDWRGLGSVGNAAVSVGLSQLNLIVWGKTNAGMGSLYRSQHELLPLFKKGDAAHRNNVALGQKGRWRSNLWTYPGASTVGSDARRGLADHPTVKPVVMLKEALLDVTDRGEIVLDPFLGSGSTLIAAEQTGRRCRGIEIDPRYVDLIIRRFENATKTSAIHRDTGETFAALAARRAREASDARATIATGRSAGRLRPARAGYAGPGIG